MVIPFLAQEISGIANQTYNSGAINKKFVADASSLIWTELGSLDTFNPVDYITSANSIERFADSSSVSASITSLFATSSAFDGRLDTLEAANSVADISWTTPTAGDGISLDGTTGMVSGALTIKVDEDAVTQAMLKSGASYWSGYLSGLAAFNENSDVDHDQTTNFVESEHIDHLDGYLSGSSISSTTIQFNAFAGQTDATAAEIETLTDGSDADSLHTHASLANWSGAAEFYTVSGTVKTLKTWYDNSSNKLTHKSGWHTGADDSTVTHNLNAIPGSIFIQPSGPITFATGYDTVTTTQFNVRISAPGERTVNWRVEI